MRLGLAISDALGITAQPVKLVDARKEDPLDAIAEVVAEREVARIVVGLPRNMDASLGPQAKEAQAFAAALEERFNLPVVLWDERLSTIRAEREMLNADLTRARRKKRRDIMAAQFILQNYLDAQRNA